MAKRLIVANWKMNCNPHDASLLMHRLEEKITASPDVEVVICPPFIDLYPMSRTESKAKFRLGSQNLHHPDEGPYTGEISAAMLKGLVDYAIIGHSERRQFAGENDKLIAQKVAAALRHDIKPILCVGDSLLDREHGAAKKVVIDQLEAGLAHVTAEELADVVIAYEPVWAISKGDGHGTYAKPDEVIPIVSAIRHTIEELYGETAGTSVRLLYGGSANADNVGAYLDISGIDGLLVGGVSLKPDEFAQIVARAAK